MAATGRSDANMMANIFILNILLPAMVCSLLCAVAALLNVDPSSRQGTSADRVLPIEFWPGAHGLILSTIPSSIKSVLQWSVGIVKRCEIDPMQCSNCLDLVDPLLSDESSSLRERLEPVFQSKSHAFE